MRSPRAISLLPGYILPRFSPSPPHQRFHLLRPLPITPTDPHQKSKMSQITEEIRSKAEMYYGDEMCQDKSKLLLKEVGLPNGLLPLKDMEECGIVRETGFVWLKQKKKSTHKFEKIGKLVSYEPLVTAYVESGKIKKLNGVTTKELLIWVSLSDIYVDDPPTGKITFKTPAGLFRSFPVSAFVIEEKEPTSAAETTTTKEGKPVKEADATVEVREV